MGGNRVSEGRLEPRGEARGRLEALWADGDRFSEGNVVTTGRVVRMF